MHEDRKKNAKKCIFAKKIEKIRNYLRIND